MFYTTLKRMIQNVFLRHIRVLTFQKIRGHELE